MWPTLPMGPPCPICHQHTPAPSRTASPTFLLKSLMTTKTRLLERPTERHLTSATYHITTSNSQPLMDDKTVDHPSPQSVLDVVTHPVRRQIIRFIDSQSSGATESHCDEVEQSAPTWIPVVDLHDVDDTTSATLRDEHLPALAASGFIKWEANSHRVRAGPHFNHVVSVLSLADQLREIQPHGNRD